MHIAIAGNIGSGKTTLTGLLAKHFGWTPHYEDVDTNPYLNSFYEDMQRWSFNLQIYFLNSRFRQVVEIRNRVTRWYRTVPSMKSTYLCTQPAFHEPDEHTGF